MLLLKGPFAFDGLKTHEASDIPMPPAGEGHCGVSTTSQDRVNPAISVGRHSLLRSVSLLFLAATDNRQHPRATIFASCTNPVHTLYDAPFTITISPAAF